MVLTILLSGRGVVHSCKVIRDDLSLIDLLLISEDSLGSYHACLAEPVLVFLGRASLITDEVADLHIALALIKGLRLIVNRLVLIRC